MLTNAGNIVINIGSRVECTVKWNTSRSGISKHQLLLEHQSYCRQSCNCEREKKSNNGKTFYVNSTLSEHLNWFHFRAKEKKDIQRASPPCVAFSIQSPFTRIEQEMEIVKAPAYPKYSNTNHSIYSNCGTWKNALKISGSGWTVVGKCFTLQFRYSYRRSLVISDDTFQMYMKSFSYIFLLNIILNMKWFTSIFGLKMFSTINQLLLYNITHKDIKILMSITEPEGSNHQAI